MGLFDNIIGTANDGEEATDMDTIIEKIESGEIDAISDTPVDIKTASDSSGWSTGDDSSSGTGDPKDDTSTDAGIETTKTDEVVNIDSIDIGGDMTMLITDDMANGTETPDIGEAIEEKVAITSETVVEEPIIVAEEVIPEESIVPVDDTSITSNLLNMTDTPTPDILAWGSLLDMTDTTSDEAVVSLVEEPVIQEQIVEPTAMIDEVLISTDTSLSDSLEAAKSGFADELNSLRQKDEDLIAHNQAEIKKLEDAKLAMQSAERAIESDIAKLAQANEDLKADEAQIDHTLSTLHIKS